MTQWVNSTTGLLRSPIDPEVLEEAALAMAQFTIQKAMDQTGTTRADLARRMERNRSFISRIMSGSHNLTIKTMARALAACGFEVRFESVPIVWNWVNPVSRPPERVLSAFAGSTIPITEMVGIVLPTLAN